GAPKLMTGFVRASGYANKVRRVLFAITRGKVFPEEVVKAAGELNKIIFEKLQEMGVKKEDVVRISVDFNIEDGKIVWNLDSLEIETYKKEEEEKLALAMEEVEHMEKMFEETVKELEALSDKLREISKEISELVERMKQEYTGLKLRSE
uniref:ssDNA binding protein n=1 Tax=Pyrococcus furiosus (strain ATCC 43587 / DSM 3638 / JCM 8422 / Vc1) TaxID=186497 RepID=UPI0004540D7F